jgi:mannose-6-phosphate isomerase-like protein (cupin superfamily)
VADSGWRAGGPPTEVAFSAKGQVLATELRRWHSGEQREQTGPEEVGAVLEGHFELRCGDERHELAAGQGILIPAGEPHVWQILSDTGVLYRVTGPAS